MSDKISGQIPADLLEETDIALAAADDLLSEREQTPVTAVDETAILDQGDLLEEMVLSLDDLFPDENGEVVISTQDGLSISLLTDEAPQTSGVADDHVTAAGIDVSGLHFHSFDGGLTIYFDPDAPVEISSL